MKPRSNPLLRLAAAVALGIVGSVHADTLTWDGGSSSNWNTTEDNWTTSATWNNTTPDSAIFNTTTGNINLTEAITAGSLTFGVSNANTTGSFSGSNLTINGDLIATADANNNAGGPLVTFSNNVTVGGSVLIARRVLGVATGGSLTANTIGSNGAWGRLEISGGTVTATNGVDDTGGIMSVFLNEGSLHTPYIKTTSISWTALGNDGVVLNGGTLYATANAADFIQTYEINGWGNRNNVGVGTNGANINTNSFDISITKSLQNYGGAGTLTKSGAGTLTLTGANTYTGNTTINGGTLKIAEGASIYNGGYNGSAILTVNNGATLELNRWGYGPGSANQSLGGLDYNPARFVINGGTVKYTGGAAGAPTAPGESPYGPGFTIGALGATLDAATAGETWTVKYDSRGYGPIASNDGGTLTLTGVGSGVFDKELGGTGGVTMNGSATWELNRTNTYTGATTVNSGKLLITGSTAAGSAVTVASGATLGGTGTVGGATTIQSGGHLAVGNSPGTQTFSSSLTFNSGSIFDWELNADTADTGSSNQGTYDKVIANGNVTGTSVFTIALGTNAFTDGFWNTNKSWTDIFTGSGSFDLSTLFTTFGGTSVASNGLVTGQGQFSFTSNTLNWTAVPEPTSALAGLLLTAGLLRRRR
jgi:fibronectin-binding autotransporter adhesin